MRFYDFKCQLCGHTDELLLGKPVDFARCYCGGNAVRVWVKGPMVGNKQKGKYPYFDIQLGVTLESPQHRDRIAKERGLTILGNDEWERTRKAQPEEAPPPTVNHEKWIQAAEETYAQMIAGNIPNVTVPTLADVDAPSLISDENGGF